jgi:hypothetical protein
MTSSADINNLLGLARTALIGGNNAEALSYFNRVLEVDSKHSEAWIGKGKASAWQSTLANIRINEALIAFNHAIATADEAAKAERIEEAVEDINKVVVALYGLARDHMIEFVSLDNSWPDYLKQVAQLIDGLEAAKNWSPENRITLENIVHLCKDNIEGYSFRDQYNSNISAAHSVAPEYEQFLRTRMDEAVSGLQALDSSYSAPTIEKQKADACFVVTATMGDFDHPHVTLLRRFRDRWILERRWGEGFVAFYYRHGPKLARVIEKSNFLRGAAYWTIVLPATLVARSKLDDTKTQRLRR